MATTITWDNADFAYNSNSYTWDDVILVIKATGGGLMAEDMPWTKWEDSDENKKNLIKLICKVLFYLL